ncbi:uncharacterized protein A4U43_C07F27230 [Asparagus officinalis]|uniref:Uncharacterized protein n=1 Tax=Asparagus officinalis TaxID=4686 RepID=A0A5P1EH72_ASPOF|nr:uncharacterized protein A4U43_C07F27230 [Asparagus officinalis]
MEIREGMVDSLKALDSQKSAEIDKLKHELLEWNKRIKFLSEEVSRGSGARDESEGEAVESSVEEAGEDLSKDSVASSSRKKASEGGKSKVLWTPSPPPTNTSLSLTPGRGVDTP